MAMGLESLDLALIHEQALIAYALSAGIPADQARVIRRARSFFAEATIPIEETHRSAMEANAHLGRLNRALSRRALNLIVSSRLLKKQIARRHVVEQALRQSKQRTTRVLQQSRHLQKQLRHLSRRILAAQEEERKRVSRELHDVIAQMLTGINVRLATLKVEATMDAKGLGRKISHTQRLVEKSVDIVNRFARELRPAALDDLGLIPALHTLVRGFAKETGILVSVTAFAKVEELSGAKRTVLYRVVQEALTNVARHARAGRVDVVIEKLPNAVRMKIKDNGVAFDVQRVFHSGRRRHFGLMGMRERVEMIGGRFGIESSPGEGTTIKAQIPFRGGSREKGRP